MYQGKNWLITGAAGFIGANFVRYVLNASPQASIVSFDKLTYAGCLDHLTGLDEARHTFVQGDILDRAHVLKLLEDYQIDTIVHFAAESHVDRSIEGPAVFVETNVLGTQALLEAARMHWLEEKQLDASSCRFHHISTDEVYGSLSLDDPAFHENSLYSPNSPYSASKAGSDHLVNAYHETYQLPITLTNCSNNYGPFQHAEKLIPTVIRCCAEQRPIPVYGDGSNIRDWLYVEDHCEAIMTVIEKGRVGERYNVGGLCELSNLELVRHICQAYDEYIGQKSGSEQLISFVEDRKGHDWRYAVNIEKIQNTLSWLPKISIEVGIKKTIESYGEEGAKLERTSLNRER